MTFLKFGFPNVSLPELGVTFPGGHYYKEHVHVAIGAHVPTLQAGRDLLE